MYSEFKDLENGSIVLVTSREKMDLDHELLGEYANIVACISHD